MRTRGAQKVSIGVDRDISCLLIAKHAAFMVTRDVHRACAAAVYCEASDSRASVAVAECHDRVQRAGDERVVMALPQLCAGACQVQGPR